MTVKDFSKFLGCESPEEKRQRTLREKIDAEKVYAAAREALESYEAFVYELVEDDIIRARRAQLRRERQTAFDEMEDARSAYRFAHKITREEWATRPPRYRPELDRRDGSWTKR